MTDEQKEKIKMFTQDRNWNLVVELFDSHIKPLRDIMTIDSQKSNDEIASEVRGRQLTIKGVSGFLKDAQITSKENITSKTSFE